MNTSYDTVWQTFLENCKVSDIDLPQDEERIYEVIKNGVLHLNNRLQEDYDYECDDVAEEVSPKLSGDHLLILAHFIRYIFLKNQRTYFANLWQPFSKDITIRNFSSQLSSLDKSVSEAKEDIDLLIRNMEEDFL